MKECKILSNRKERMRKDLYSSPLNSCCVIQVRLCCNFMQNTR
ncbi:hypothetical protein HMPREF0971_02916 [Segatella oris F0302]|uniref:Uncharacterized protein n=1 Tax=Segatella oris F0302 TaxID=649760 RepID=D1QVD8_9BACT|nr:hypothetical protein HMPREF0971_02916 [Segatella oris F0302]